MSNFPLALYWYTRGKDVPATPPGFLDLVANDRATAFQG